MSPPTTTDSGSSAASHSPTSRYLVQFYPGQTKATMGSEILNDFNSRIIDFNRSLPKDESQPIEPKASVVPVDATASEVRAEYGKCRAAPQGRLPDQGRSYMQAFERQQADLTTLGDNESVLVLTAYLPTAQEISAMNGKAEDDMRKNFFDSLGRAYPLISSFPPGSTQAEMIKEFRGKFESIAGHSVKASDDSDARTMYENLMLAMEPQRTQGSQAGPSRGPASSDATSEKPAGPSNDGKSTERFNEKRG